MKRMSSFCVAFFIAALALTAHCGSKSEKMAEQKTEAKRAVVTIDSVAVRAGDSLNVPVRLENSDSIGGIQLRIQFDPKVLAVDKPRTTQRSPEMMIMHNVKENELLIMMFSMSGKSIPPGKGSVLVIPCKISKGAVGGSNLDIKEALLARPDSQSIPSSSKSGKIVIRKN